jgi:hypothetical protein
LNNGGQEKRKGRGGIRKWDLEFLRTGLLGKVLKEN